MRPNNHLNLQHFSTSTRCSHCTAQISKFQHISLISSIIFIRFCKNADIGCIECKQPVIDSVLKELKPIQERALHYIESPDLVKSVVAEGCEKARKIARDTMRDVRKVMGVNF